MQKNEKMSRIQTLVLQNKMNEAMEYCIRCAEDDINDKEILICYLLFLIRNQELQNNEMCIFEFSNELEILNQHYHALKFLVRRLEFDWLLADQMELIRYCVENGVSLSAITFIVKFSTRDPQYVLNRFRQLFIEYKEFNSQY